MLVIEFIFNL